MPRATALVCVLALSLPLLAASTSLAARSSVGEISLEWTPSAADAGTAAPEVDVSRLAGVRIRIDRFGDARTGPPGVVGENRGASNPPQEVTTPGDVPDFVTDQFLAILRAHGLPVVDDRLLREMGADIVDKKAIQVRLRGEVQQFFVTETESCDAEVRLGVAVEDSQGRPIWTGTSSGRAGRVARSYKAADYQGALSDALLEATNQLLSSSDFLHALEGRR